jgi:hypothetical protein
MAGFHPLTGNGPCAASPGILPAAKSSASGCRLMEPATAGRRFRKQRGVAWWADWLGQLRFEQAWQACGITPN